MQIAEEADFCLERRALPEKWSLSQTFIFYVAHTACLHFAAKKRLFVLLYSSSSIIIIIISRRKKEK